MIYITIIIFGKITSPPNLNGYSIQNLPQNIIEILPLDLQLNQRFVLDPNQPKTNLNLCYDFTNDNSFMMNDGFSYNYFQINLTF